MNELDFSTLGHAQLCYANPLSETKLQQAAEICRESKPGRILDIGSGNMYILQKFVRETGATTAVGVDNRSIDTPLPESIEVVCADANDWSKVQSVNTFDVSLCIGSCHAFGDYSATLKELSRLTKKGGLIVVGDGYWQQKPDPGYLEHLHGTEDELQTHAGNLIVGEDLGLTPLWARTATIEEWDQYEWSYAKSIEDYFFEHPQHSQRNAFLQRISQWRRGYWRWGRETLGFGLYIFRVNTQQ